MKTKIAFTFFSLLFIVCGSMAQAFFIIDSLPGYTPPEDTVYIAGDFNGWNPGDENYRLYQNDIGKWNITMPARSEGTKIRFKFTLGSWERVEKGPQGEEIDNRIFTYGNGDTVSFTVYNWADGSGGGSTAAENVLIMDEQFYMPQLERSRRIWIYLPPDYDFDTNRYPVIYMHDGQNLFDQRTSFAGEWEVDETLNALAEEGKRVPIVVGIDNGGSLRIDELTPWLNPEYGGGDGDRYMAFIVETLKPYVDEHYRTLPDRAHTAVAGSSLGGLISHYGALKYPDIFAKAGIFSPSFWFSDSVWRFVARHPQTKPLRMYMMCGSEESPEMVPDMLAMKDSLIRYGYVSDKLKTKVVAGGQHNEKLWSGQFREMYLYLFDDYVNSVPLSRVEKYITVYPNPVGDLLYFNGVKPKQNDTLIITDIRGKVMLEQTHLNAAAVKVCGLPPGLYFIQMKSRSAVYAGQFIKQ